MPSMAETAPAQVVSAAAAGGDKRRKKQATKRMEQLIKIHTENVDLSDAGEQLQLVRKCSNIQLNCNELINMNYSVIIIL